MAKKRIKRNDRYSNTYNLGGWMNGVNNKIDASSFGKAIGGSSGLGGITNAATSIVSGLINPRGNSTGVGNTLKGIGSIASNIPGIGGVIGAGVNLVGGLVNATFGSNLNEEFIAQTEDKTKQQAGYISSAEDNASLLSDWTSYTDMAHVKRSDVGSDGWFSNKAKNKTKSLNRAIDEANLRAWHSLNNTASNVDTNNDFLAMANFSAYGGPIFSTGAIGYDLASRDLNNKQMKALGDIRLTSLPNSFNAMPDVSTINTFKDGGIFIKPENRGKFTALKERTGKSSTWYKEHGTPAQKKMATFALNAAKWKHADGGELHTHGGDFTNGLTYIDNGGSHEANPFEGVQMGIDPQGVPNLVEEGEIIFNDYVFSNRLKVPKAIRQKYRLRDNITFADAAKKLSKESEDRPNDPISKRGLESFMSALAESQEEVRISKELHKARNNKFAYGGSIKDIIEEFKSVKPDDLDSWTKNNPYKRSVLGALMNWLRTADMSQGLDLVPKKEVIDKIESIYDQLDDLDKEEIEKYIEETIKNLNNSSSHFKEDFYNPLINYEYYRDNTLGGLRSSTFAKGNKFSYIDKAIAKYGMEKPLSEITEDEWKKIYEDSQKEFENSILYGTDADNSDIKQEDIRDVPGLDFPYMSMPQLGSIPRVPNIEVKNTPLDTSYIAYRTESELNDADFTMEGASMPEITITPDVTGFNVQDREYSIGFPSITPRNNNRGTTYIDPLDIQEDEGIGIPLEITRNFSGLEFPSMGMSDLKQPQMIAPLSVPKPHQDTNNSNMGKLANLRYIPAIASGVSTISDLFSKPDYSAADIVDSINITPQSVSYNPLGTYLSYKPLDRMFYINQLNKNTAASRRAIQNTSGGNRAAAMASILAADYNYGENLGKLARQAEEYNQAQKEKVAGFNRQTDMFNSQQSMQAQSANAQFRNDATKMRLAQAEEVAKLRSAAKNAYDTRRSNNLNNFINNLGNIGWEDYQREWINSNPALYYNLSGIGRVGYKGNGKKNGGKLKKNRRTTYA